MSNMKIVGIGGMGGRFVTRFNSGPFKDACETVIFHTRKKDLSKMVADRPVFIGEETFLDKGTKGDPMAGAGAAEMSAKKIAETLVGAEKVCLVAAMGGGTGTGAAPVVARLARLAGVKRVVAIVALPFQFEGLEREQKAKDGLKRLGDTTDLVMAFPNDRLCDEGHMCSLEVPHGWADRPGERFVLGDQMRSHEDRFFMANERLVQAAFWAMESEGLPGGAEENQTPGPLRWLGMGGSTIGERGLWESLARATHWSVIPGEPAVSVDRWRIQVVLGEERPSRELSTIPSLLTSLLRREVEVTVSQRFAPRLGQKIRLALAGY